MSESGLTAYAFMDANVSYGWIVAYQNLVRSDRFQYVADLQEEFLYVRFRVASLRLASANISHCIYVQKGTLCLTLPYLLFILYNKSVAGLFTCSTMRGQDNGQCEVRLCEGFD